MLGSIYSGPFTVVDGAGVEITNLGLTGGGNNTHQIYVDGEQAHRLKDGDIVEHLVELAEKKAAEIEAALGKK